MTRSIPIANVARVPTMAIPLRRSCSGIAAPPSVTPSRRNARIDDAADAGLELPQSIVRGSTDDGTPSQVEFRLIAGRQKHPFSHDRMCEQVGAAASITQIGHSFRRERRPKPVVPLSPPLRTSDDW